PALGATRSRPADQAMMGDIVRARGPARLSVSVLGDAPIERVVVFAGTEPIATRRPYASSAGSRRVRVVWEGAEYRGRGRQVSWDGEMRLTGNAVERTRPLNFLNPERLLDQNGKDRISWTSVTTG